MLKIRLQRIGKKNSPSYRVVLVEHTAPPQGKFQEILGFYNSKLKQKELKKDRIEYWISKGVQLSPTIHNLLVGEGILKKEKVRAWKPKKKKGESVASQPVADKQAAPSSPESAGGESKPEKQKPLDTNPV